MITTQEAVAKYRQANPARQPESPAWTATTPDHYLILGAHPDDIETMLGYVTLTVASGARALVATDGNESTLNRTRDRQFVKDGCRRVESQAGLATLGIDPNRQIYLGLADGALSANAIALSDTIAEIAEFYNLRRIVTLGEHGYDEHPDHIATHRAAARAVNRLQDIGRRVSLLALHHQHEGQYHVPASEQTRHRKLGAMACHASQFGITHENQNVITIEEKFWAGFQCYHPLILDRETYDLLATEQICYKKWLQKG